MISSNPTSSTASNKIPSWLVILFFVAALVGFVDSSYLTAEHVRGVIPPCSIVAGCERVLTSAYATIAGIPVSVLGMAYYALLILLLIAYFDTHTRTFVHTACWIAMGGFLMTLYFVFVQAFILHAFCQFCLLSALMSLMLLFTSIRIMRID